MLVLGLLLIIAALAVGFGAVYDGSETATVEILGQTLETTVAGVFVAGAVSMLVLLLGALALASAMGRSRRKRSQRKEAKTRQTASVQQLEDERAALRAENERLAERLSDTGTPMGSTAGGTAAGGAAAGGGAMAAGSDDDDQDHDPDHDRAHAHEQHTGPRGLMDKMTGRSGHDETAHDDRVVASSTGSPRSTDSTDTQTDLTTTEQTSSSGRHRDEV